MRFAVIGVALSAAVSGRANETLFVGGTVRTTDPQRLFAEPVRAKHANLLGAGLFRVEPARIHAVSVDMTMLGGRVVHETRGVEPERAQALALDISLPLRHA